MQRLVSPTKAQARLQSTQATAVPFTPHSFDAGAPVPLYRQLYDALRAVILSGQVRAGARLPSTRALATDLGLSRTTVLTAMEQLLAEGYVEGKVGSGTYVASVLPDTALQAGAGIAAPVPVPVVSRGPMLSRRGQLLAVTPVSTARDAGPVRTFRTGVPALDSFPWKTWIGIETRCLRRVSGLLHTYDDPAGYQPLREVIADYLGAARAVRCDAGQVIVVAGSQQALDLVARVLLDPGDAVLVEDPGYMGAKGALVASGVRLVPAPVDEEGLDVAAAMDRCPGARLAYVTPSHQFPLGVTMSLSRRLALLRWASEAGAWILEDDYDSEYRYTGRPLAALQGLDRDGRVIYVGTFSKVLFPALRLGYLVAPPDLVDAFARARALTDRGSPVLEQAVVAEFLSEGHFSRHIRRMRMLYGERQEALVQAMRQHLAGALEVSAHECGMHLVGRLPDGADDRRASDAAARHGIEASPLSAYGIEPCRTRGFALGYAPFDERQIREGVARLVAALDV